MHSRVRVGRTLLFIAALSFVVEALTPVERHGRLSVAGNRIQDQSGNAVQLRGMSLFWSQWMGKYWNADVVAWLADDWKATTVRAPMAVEHGGYLTNPSSEKQKVRTVVDAAIAEGLYVIIDWHDHNAHSHLDQATSFFAEMAQTYGTHPNVIYEIFNEPEEVSWSGTVKPYAEAVIDAIRGHDPDNLILVGTPRWCQDVEAAANDPIDRANIAYVLHFYAASHKDWLRQAARNALDGGVALFVSEWGTCEYTGDGYLDRAETRNWLSFMDQHKLSWCNWSIADKAETAAALVGGAGTSGGWPESRLTASGKLLRSALRSYTADTSSPPPPDTTFPIPGTIEAEAFSASRGVETETTTDEGGGQNIGYIDDGDWAEYAVRVEQEGRYELLVRVASETSGGTIEVLVDGSNRGTLSVAGTGGWQNWTTLQTDIVLPAGDHTLRLRFSGGAQGLFNINWFLFGVPTVSALEEVPEPRIGGRPSLFRQGTGLQLRLPEAHGFTSYTVHSAEGRVVRRGTIGAGTEGVDVGRLPPGVWFLRLRSPLSAYAVPVRMTR